MSAAGVDLSDDDHFHYLDDVRPCGTGRERVGSELSFVNRAERTNGGINRAFRIRNVARQTNGEFKVPVLGRRRFRWFGRCYLRWRSRWRWPCRYLTCFLRRCCFRFHRRFEGLHSRRGRLRCHRRCRFCWFQYRWSRSRREWRSRCPSPQCRRCRWRFLYVGSMARFFSLALPCWDDPGLPLRGGAVVGPRELGCPRPLAVVSGFTHAAQCALRLGIRWPHARASAARARTGRMVALSPGSAGRDFGRRHHRGSGDHHGGRRSGIRPPS
jgi:hypothetical protein